MDLERVGGVDALEMLASFEKELAEEVVVGGGSRGEEEEEEEEEEELEEGDYEIEMLLERRHSYRNSCLEYLACAVEGA